jgi:hypothetical protein
VTEKVQRVKTKVYILGGIAYLPHLTRELYVGPDLSYWTAEELLRAGAQPDHMMLWPRQLRA